MESRVRIISINHYPGEPGEALLKIPERIASETISISMQDKINGEYAALNFLVSKIMGTIKPNKVIFHNPATIVYWNDGTKTVVKCDERDTYSKEAGLALCYMKKMLGSSRVFNDVLKEWTDNE